MGLGGSGALVGVWRLLVWPREGRETTVDPPRMVTSACYDRNRPAGTRTIYKTSIPTGTSTPTPGTCATEGAAPGGGSVHRSTATDRRRHGQTESVYSTSTCVGLVRQHLLTTVYYVLTTVYIGCSSVSGSTISSSRKIDLCHSQSKRLELQTGLKLALAVYATHGQLHTQRRIEGDWIIGESA